MTCPNCKKDLPVLNALSEWMRLYELQQRDPRAVSPERMSEAFARLQKEQASLAQNRPH